MNIGFDALGILEQVHATMSLVSTIITVILIPCVVYLWVRYEEFRSHEKRELKQRFLERQSEGGFTTKKSLWEKIETYMRSDNPSDWKIAILEADNMLDEVVTQMGYAGEGLGEKMKAIDSAKFPYLDQAWEAHKFRNDIAHTANRPLTRADADRVVGLFQRVFKELKVI